MHQSYFSMNLRRIFCASLLLTVGIDLASAGSVQIPNSDIDYPGASASTAFVAKEPFVLNIQDVSTKISLGGFSRAHDFGGSVPFVNPVTNKNDPSVFQAWSSALGGLVDWYNYQITNNGVPGRIGKTTYGTDAVTMIKYNAGDDIAYEKCRTKIGSYPIPPRTHVRWDFEVAFGKADGANDWILTPSAHWGQDSAGNWIIDNGGSPVLFFQVKSLHNQGNPSLALHVDTDNLDSTKLMISMAERAGGAASITEIARVHGLSRHTLIPISIEAYLDERPISKGGKGALKLFINNTLVLEKVGPNLTLGKDTHEWSIENYLWNESHPYKNNRTTFYKTAKMMVYPMNAVTPAPAPVPALAAPTNLRLVSK